MLIAMRVVTSTGRNALYFLSSDHLGSSSLTTNMSGTLVARQLYDAWGNIRSGGAMPTDIGYTGQRLDSYIKLLFLRSRYYSPDTARFLSKDSWQGDYTRPQSLDAWSYTEGNPVNRIDPNGLCPRPPADMLPAICLALFIKPDRVPAALWILHGDNRDFSSNSDPDASRGFIWIQTEQNNFAWKMNRSGYVIPFSPPYGGERIDWFERSDQNEWWITNLNNHDNKQRTVTYDLVLAGPLEYIAPHINGTLTFLPRGDGKQFDAFGPIDGFPWVEAYYWNSEGNVQTIFQQAAIDSDPENLNNIEPLHDACFFQHPLYPLYSSRDFFLETILLGSKNRGVITYIDTRGK